MHPGLWMIKGDQITDTENDSTHILYHSRDLHTVGINRSTNLQ